MKKISGRNPHYTQQRTDHELTVFSKAQDLIQYSLNITEKYPKKERFVLTVRIQNTTLDIYEHLIHANETFIDLKTLKDMKKTINVLESRKKNATESESEQYWFRENKLLLLRINFSNKYDDRINVRRNYQNQALTCVKKLAFLIRLSFQKKYISARQYEYWSEITDEVKKMIAGWIKSDRERYQY